MPLDSILNHILAQANTQRDKIIQEARLAANKIIQEAKQEAETLYQDVLSKEKSLSLAQKQKLLVHARLEEKKNLLKAKQELIDNVFEKLKSTLKSDKFKKQQVYADRIKEVPEDIDFYLHNLRLEYETEIANILFLAPNSN